MNYEQKLKLTHVMNTGKAYVKFLKKNGEEREMLCTRLGEYGFPIPEDPKYMNLKKECKGVCVVELLKDGTPEKPRFRRFNFDSIISFSPISEELLQQVMEKRKNEKAKK